MKEEKYFQNRFSIFLVTPFSYLKGIMSPHPHPPKKQTPFALYNTVYQKYLFS